MPLKSRVYASQRKLVFFILIVVAMSACSAFGQTISISVSSTTPAGLTTCPAGGSTCGLIHGQAVQYAAQTTVPANFNPTVSWSFSPTIGTLSSTGLYTAPASVFQNFTITITAYFVQDPSKFATATVTLTPTVSVGLTPNTATLSDGQTQQFTATVQGTGNTAVTWAISPPDVGFISNTGLYTAPAPVQARQTVTVTVKSVADPINGIGTATITLVPAAQVGVNVSPPSVTIRSGGDTQQFTAIVVGLSNTAVTWSISPNIGSITSAGLYLAPANITTNQMVTVTATSAGTDVNGNRYTGTAIVTLTPPAITISPANVTLTTNQTQQFSASVNNAPFPNVMWSLSSGFGTINAATGLYTAPAFASTKLTIQVIATSNLDPTYSGNTTVTITQSAVTLSPSNVSLTSGGTQQFVFAIDATPDANPAQDLMWSISPNTGTISSAGLYTAPASVTTGGTVTVTATFLADATKTAKATVNLAVFTDVGHGAPNSAIQELFVTNFYRNNFYNLVSLPPVGDVKRLGATPPIGYVQEFQDANKTGGVKFALVKPNDSTAVPADGSPLVFQLYGDLYGYYTSVGVATAGYPKMDTQNCPFFDPNNSCTWDLFDKGVALFVYKVPIFASQTSFTVSGTIYTKWIALGGMASGPGRATDAAVAITSSTKVTANEQTFAGGAIFQITSGANNAKVFSVLTPTFDLYLKQGGPTGYLGLPIGDELTLTGGDHRQSFEGGAIQYTPGSDPSVRLPVASISLNVSSTTPMHLNLGDTTTLKATPQTTTGAVLADRAVTWSTTNGQVVTIAQTSGTGGSTATVKAVGSGTASVRASADGIVSSPVVITVTSPCCQVGEGAPSSIISQAFQSAVTRDHLNVVLPAQTAVQRQGHGYVQQLQDATPGSTTTYLLTKSDSSAAAYVVTGVLLISYQQMGGPGGSLGFPTGDASAGGTQVFENSAALAGKPVILVAGAIFTKWSVLGLETGAAGLPNAAAVPFKTVGASGGNSQQFKNGVIYAATSGPRSGQVYYVSGLILAQYSAIGGPAGAFGMPVSDEFASGINHRQNFENGYIDYNTGETSAQAHAAAQKPSVNAPQSVLAGSRVHLAITGFQAGAVVRVSITGQPDFTVTAANGSYGWDAYIPLTAKAATVSIQAADTNSGDLADASYNILSLANNRAQFIKVQGDVQTGLPGALLPQMLQVALKDQSGNPVIGAAITFQASPGAVIVPAAALTDQNGMAQVALRLPPSQGLAAVTADSPGVAAAPVTFYATATSSSLTSFPKLSQAVSALLGNGTATIVQKGALLTAVASILRYHQNRGELPTPVALADATSLNTFLKAFCAFDAQGKQICDGFQVNPDSGEQVVNLWRAGEFVSGSVDVSVEKSDLNTIRDLVAQGSPVLLSLSLAGDTQPAGGHYVVAVGVGPNGEVLIQDPSPTFAQPQLDGYINGFQAAGRTWTGQVIAAVRLLPRLPSGTRFLLAAVSQPPALLQGLTLEAVSSVGSCGSPADLTDAADPNAPLPAAPLRISRYVACDGTQPLYQINAGALQPYRVTLTDLARGGTQTDLSSSSPAAYKATRPAALLVLGAPDLTVLPDGVVNGASLTTNPGIAPGGLFRIVGGGLAAAGANPTVTFDGHPVEVQSSSPFQVTALVPADLPPGPYTLQVQSPFGSVSQPVQVMANAPAIFTAAVAGHSAVVNADGNANSNLNPAVRGQSVIVYATGLGTVQSQGNTLVVIDPVVAVLAGTEITPSSASLTPELVGVYQLTVPIPAGTPPGLDLPLLLRQGGVDGNVVNFSVQ